MHQVMLCEADRNLIADLTAEVRRLRKALGEPLVSRTEAARLLGKHPNTIHRWIAHGKLNLAQQNGRVGIPKSEIDNLMNIAL